MNGGKTILDSTEQVTKISSNFALLVKIRASVTTVIFHATSVTTKSG